MATKPFFAISVLTVFDDLLDLVKVLNTNDTLVRVCDVVGRNGAFVLDLLFGNAIRLTG